VGATTVRARFHNASPTLHQSPSKSRQHIARTIVQERKGDVPLLFAIDISTWPGVNQAFLFSFIVAIALTLVAIPYGKRRPIGTPFSWGESMLASVYVFAVMFIAYGIVPDRWIQHADKNLEWSKQKILFGPFDLLKPKVYGGNFPFTISYQELRDIVVVLIHVIFFGLQIWIWSWWQKRGKKAPSTEVETSTYGRPLVKKV
jgi:hypothetical protein